VEQLSLHEPLRPNGIAVWGTLNDQQKTAAIATLVRLIVQAVIGAHTEQEHQHE
jgi:heme A synthase